MTDLTTACSSLPRALRQPDRHAGQPVFRRDAVGAAAQALSWMWAQWRRREIIRTLERVDDRLLRDAGIEPDGIADFVDALMARRR
jgi:uncharacterized protein YjiS (DUF1127 family)